MAGMLTYYNSAVIHASTPFLFLVCLKKLWEWQRRIIPNEQSHLTVPCQYYYQWNKGFWRREMGWNFNWFLAFPGFGTLSQMSDDLHRSANWTTKPRCFPKAFWEAREKGEVWSVPDAYVFGFLFSMLPLRRISGAPSAERKHGTPRYTGYRVMSGC